MDGDANFSNSNAIAKSTKEFAIVSLCVGMNVERYIYHAIPDPALLREFRSGIYTIPAFSFSSLQPSGRFLTVLSIPYVATTSIQTICST